MFFKYSFFLNQDSSLQVLVDAALETTRYLRIKSLEVCLQLGPGDRRCFQIGTGLCGFNLADLNNCFDRTTCTRGYFTPEFHSPDPKVSATTPGFEIKCFSFLLWRKLCLPTSPTRCDPEHLPGPRIFGSHSQRAPASGRSAGRGLGQYLPTGSPIVGSTVVLVQTILRSTYHILRCRTTRNAVSSMFVYDHFMGPR